MAGALLNMGYAWAAAIVAVLGVITTMQVTDDPAGNSTASNVTAIAVTVFTVAVVASVAL